MNDWKDKYLRLKEKWDRVTEPHWTNFSGIEQTWFGRFRLFVGYDMMKQCHRCEVNYVPLDPLEEVLYIARDGFSSSQDAKAGAMVAFHELLDLTTNNNCGKI